MKLTAFTAKKETGKTTAVKYLRKDLSNSVQINFKDALIDELKMYFPELLIEIGRTYDNNSVTYDGTPWDVDRLFREKPPLIRKLMRDWGTVFRRGQDPDYWVKEWEKRFNANTIPDVFVDDVRFLNEAAMIKKYGGTLIRIRTDKPIPEDAHTSESEMDLIVLDRTVQNFFGDVDVLYKQLNQFK